MACVSMVDDGNATVSGLPGFVHDDNVETLSIGIAT